MDNIYPDRKEFLKLSKKYNLIPVYRDIVADLETPVSCFLKLGNHPYSYLLESVEGGERMARYSLIGGPPSVIFQSKGREITISHFGRKTEMFTTDKDPLAELEKLLGRYRQAPVRDLPPFSGGAVGYLGYDVVRFFERIPDKNKDVYGIPDSLFIFTDMLFVFDHIKRKIKIISNVFLDDYNNPSEAYAQATEKIELAIRQLRKAPLDSRRRVRSSLSHAPIKSNFSKAAFEKAVTKSKEYIRCGDIIQVVLSRMLKKKISAKPFDIYRGLRSINPSPYMFYLDGGDFELVGSSPEVHVRCENGRAMLRPIAGTRPRGADEKHDLALEKELLADPKERAEHIMLVDLGRNDLGRVSDYESVRVPELMVIERYSHVMHIVSLVEGRLKKNKNAFDLLRATFPAGTVSGAPKVRAMEIIDELENQKRSFYAGVVGYFSFSGNLDSCIAIRTILVKGNHAMVQAGAGLVADSKPAKEYEETENKARALFKAIELAESGGLQ